MKLYKYRTIGSEGSFERHALKEIICERRLWFAKPSTFDDKLDCRPFVSVNSMDLMREWLVERSKTNQLINHNVDIDKVLQMHTNSEWLENRWFEVADSITGVCCLSDSVDLAKQWVAYGDNCTGVCIEIDLSLHCESTQPRAVRYSDTRPVVYMDQFVTDFEYRETMTYEVLTTKAKRWESESEYRLLAVEDEYPSPGKSYLFHRDCFTNIFVGQRASSENIDYVESLLGESEIDCPFKVYRS